MMTENELRQFIISKLEEIDGYAVSSGAVATICALGRVLTGADPGRIPKPKADPSFLPARLAPDFARLLDSWGITATVGANGKIRYGVR
jgi:hypothetical protein